MPRKTGNWHRFCGVDRREDAGPQLQQFWQQWGHLRQGHEIYQLDADLSRTLPLFLHGDEGRGQKKQATMVFSCASILGYGVETRNFSKSKTKKRARESGIEKQQMNYVGDTWVTRLVLAVLPKKAFEANDAVLHSLVEVLAKDMRKVAENGVQCPVTGLRYHAAILQTKGDWPFLCKVGKLARSFYNAPKRAHGQCTGICHLCLAGRPNIPAEDLTPDGVWQFTVAEEEPWKYPLPSVLIIPHDNTFSANFLVYDPWHCWHLGEGRGFIANCVRCFLDYAPASNVDDKCDWLFQDYQTFCKREKRQAFTTRFNKNFFNLGNNYPSGSWTKGNLTTSLLKWCKHFLESRRNSFPPGSDMLLVVAWIVFVDIFSCPLFPDMV